VVYIPKRRKQRLYGALHRELGAMLHELASQIWLPDSGGAPDAGSCPHVYKHSTEIFGGEHVGYLKGKSTIAIARRMGREKNFTGEVFWARGYFVSTVGLDEAMVRAYIRNQEREDAWYDQMKLGL